MTRPKKCRAVDSLPGVIYFKPAGVPLRFIEEVHLTVEEYEALRLCDLEGLDQAECAAKMLISRATVQRLLTQARYNVAAAITQGKALRIGGGNYVVTDQIQFRPGGCCRHGGRGEAKDGESGEGDTKPT
ncbi:MAG: DUF134 domain-containing protein [Dehalogenimonas sp.]